MALQREQVVQTAEKYVARGKIEPAIREYRKLLTENPNDINTLNRIGDLYARIQRIDEAVDFFTQIAEQYTTQGFFVKAIAIYKKIIKLDPTRLEVYEKLAELYHKQGLTNEARTQYQVLADYYQKHDNAPSAIAIYQKMADVEPNNPTYHVKLAEIYQQQQLSEKAVGEYIVIAEMMLAHGRSRDAAQVYQRALDIDSGNLEFIHDAVVKLKDSGNVAAAAHFLSVATERNPQAGRLARLARVEAPVPEPEPLPPPAPPPPRRFTPPPPPEPRFTPPPEPVGPPPVAFSVGLDEDEEEVADFGADLSAADLSAADLSAADLSATVEAAGEPAPAELAAPPVGDEFELDLDEVFVLDMESEEEPPSLVKPPPDMAGAGRLGSAWEDGDQAGDQTAGAVAEETLPPLEMEEAEAPLPEVELELETAPNLAIGGEEESFEPVELPPLDSSGEIYLELEEPDLPQLDVPSWTLREEPTAPVEVPREIDADMLERTAAELQAKPTEREEDLVSEAEVLAKYGLEEKALERLREALRLRPYNLDAYAVMIQIHLGKSRFDRVAQLAGAMARAAAEVRDDAQVWPRTKKHLVAAGYHLEGVRVVAGPHLAEAVAPEPPPMAPPPAPAPPPPKAAAPPPAARRKRTRGLDIDQMLKGLLDGKPKRRPAAPAQTPAAPAASAAPGPPPAAPATPDSPPIVKFNPLEIGEMIEREELDWEPAGAGHSDAPPSPFEIPPPVVPPPPAAGEPAGQLSMEDTGVSWLDEADSRQPAGAGSERLFDEEDDFFDLAAELEQELSQEGVFQSSDGMLEQPTEQSLEEIVEGFKKGVSEHLSPTDYDTHFNLGIAYREMGLLDEAIGEFQIAAKDPRHLVLCCSMLGLCFLDKGLPELAVKWYRRGLEAPGVNEEDTLGLLYDLGCAHLALGDKDSAYKAFVDLYGINTNYRDVVARIEELGR